MLVKTNELIVKKLNELGLSIATCESITGGALCSNLVLVEHASNSVFGSLVTYATDAKLNLAKVPAEIINDYGTVSVQCARAMAISAQKTFKTDIGISTTGNASVSNPIEHQASGMAYVCIALFDKTYDLQFVSKFNNRIDIINECVAFCLNQLWELIKDLKK